MKREALVARNLQLSAARHQPSARHSLRRLLLKAVSTIPVAPARTSDRQRILLLRPDHLGDALLTLPAIDVLRTSFPDAELAALASPAAAAILKRLPALHTLESLDFPGFDRSERNALASPWLLALRLSGRLRRQQFESALVLRPDHWWGALTIWLAGIPQRVGFATAETRPFLTTALPLQREHALLRNLRLASDLTGVPPDPEANLRFPLADEDRVRASSLLDAAGLAKARRFFCIHPGTGARVKHWLPAHWARVADTLGQSFDARVVFSGSAAEQSLVQEIIGQMTTPGLDLAGKTGLGELAACYERAVMVLGPDSGPLHLAAAVGTPTVSLYGPADPVEFGPWGSTGKHRVLTSPVACSPCRILDWGEDDLAWHPCLADISVKQVVDAALSLQERHAR
ncbi:MAG: glycosyltransferase family 9 protein [Anaerolineaceae bacterium]|nr:glycosyltransferase family 9 protein [Anaerolineaceae bacterium]MDE0329909.1 glycosyltransferase family 9 protein [Anaerolineaceae bacterium]